MKNVLIIGASGSLARYVIPALKELPDVHLTLFVRNKSRIAPGLAEGCRVVEGDALDEKALEAAIAGQDIVGVNLAGQLKAMAENIVQAMQHNKVKRIIAVSAIGIYIEPLRSMLVPYRQLADVIEASGLDYTILRPDWFTDADEIDYAITRKGSPETGQAISRKSIAAFIAKIVAHPASYINENLGISKP